MAGFRASAREYERRRHRRYTVRAVKGSLREASRTELTALDLSLTGLAIETHQTLRVGSEQQLQLKGSEQQIALTVEIRWCQLVRTESGRHGDNLPVYRAGVDFRAALTHHAGALLSFIAHHVEIELTPPIPIRLDRPCAQGLITVGSATMSRLSSTRLRIETAVALQLGDQLEIVAEDTRLYLGTAATVIAHKKNPDRPGRQTDLEIIDLDHQATKALEQFIRSAVE